MSKCVHCNRHHAHPEAKDLCRQLHNERKSHATTNQELDRVWRLVPSWRISLMGAYPPLRRLLYVLAEAAELQDPSRGAPVEDTMRTQFVHVGDNASTSATEAAVLTHRHQRAVVVEMQNQLEWLTHKLSKLVPGAEAEYNPPDGECECGCGRLIYQNDKGRKRRFYSVACRQRASRKVEV